MGEALQEVSSGYPHMKEVIWKFGFYCHGDLQPGGQLHSAVCWTEDLAPVNMECFHKPHCTEDDLKTNTKAGSNLCMVIECLVDITNIIQLLLLVVLILTHLFSVQILQSSACKCMYPPPSPFPLLVSKLHCFTNFVLPHVSLI